MCHLLATSDSWTPRPVIAAFGPPEGASVSRCFSTSCALSAITIGGLAASFCTVCEELPDAARGPLFFASLACSTAAGPLMQWCQEMLAKHQTYTREHFEDMPEVRDWVWTDI
jgi:hypothetical protein